jgi:hypothetical protein
MGAAQSGYAVVNTDLSDEDRELLFAALDKKAKQLSTGVSRSSSLAPRREVSAYFLARKLNEHDMMKRQKRTSLHRSLETSTIWFRP